MLSKEQFKIEKSDMLLWEGVSLFSLNSKKHQSLFELTAFEAVRKIKN